MTILLGYLFTYGFILCTFAISLLFNKLNLVKEEGSRKIVHIMVCFCWWIINRFLGGTIHQIIIPVSMIIVNWILNKKANIPGMSRKEDESNGTVWYAVSFTVMNIVSFFVPAFTVSAGFGIFTLSFGDGFAAIFGKINSKANLKIMKHRSLFGSLSCFIFSALGIVLVSLLTGCWLSVPFILLTALFATILEFIGGRFDNLVIPFGVFGITYLFLQI
ncbi:MAG: hypothetical protein MJ188_07905 [Treponema sp.]|nr:hypothetical protein [Treponema sp.]